MLKIELTKVRDRLVDRGGFVLPAVIFTLLLLSTLSVASLVTSDDERRSASAMRESAVAFYVAEAGLNEIFATWTDYKADIDSLAPGDSLDLGWTTLPGGQRYRAVVHRWDGGEQAIYELRVRGQARGARPSQKTLSYTFTAASSEMGTGYTIGECCEAAVLLKGDLRHKPRPENGYAGQIRHTGIDTHPPNWEDAGVCADTLIDKPGLMMEDTTLFERDEPDAQLDGDPPLVQSDQINDSIFDYFGDLTWDSLRAMADIVVDGPNEDIYTAEQFIDLGDDPQIKLESDEVYPRYTYDAEGNQICDTTHPLNWGSDDPTDPCFDYFPIIVTKGEVEVRGGPSYGGDRFYGQGMIVMDYDDAAMTGSELEFETDSDFRGIVLGKGCIEIQKGAQYYGAVYLNANYDGITCDKSSNFHVDCYGSQTCDETRINWSQCAVDRTIYNSGLADFAEVAIPEGAGVVPLGERAFGELVH